jgi:DNA-binding CsgD family transcriptional regulator/predicted DNA-binding transcriptional regulator
MVHQHAWQQGEWYAKMDKVEDSAAQLPSCPDQVDTRVYSWILHNHSVDTSSIAVELGIAPEAVASSLRRLVGLQLVFPDADDPLMGYAVSPETAMAELAAPVEALIRDQQEQLAQVRAQLGAFVPHYRRGYGPGAPNPGTEVITSLQEVRAALSRASDNCRHEVLASQPGGGSRGPAAMEEAQARDRALLSRGVRMRTLYHHTARFNGPSQAYVEAASQLGGQYRTAHELFGRIIVFDRELAFIPTSDGSWGAVAIRDESTVAYLCEIFEHAWAHARPFTNASDDGLEQVARELDRTILDLLAAGLKDEAIARRLGMSLRTARRHIADIMQQLSADSRFQAGVAAARSGLLDDAARQ